MLDELLKKTMENFEEGTNVPVQELVIWSNGKEQGCSFEITGFEVEEARGIVTVRAKATWPTGRYSPGNGHLSIEGLPAEELEDVYIRAARLALCRTLDFMYPFEEEDFLSPGEEILEIDLNTGALKPKPPPNPIKKKTLGALQDAPPLIDGGLL